LCDTIAPQQRNRLRIDEPLAMFTRMLRGRVIVEVLRTAIPAIALAGAQPVRERGKNLDFYPTAP
jgi:hypothetical protein